MGAKPAKKERQKERKRRGKGDRDGRESVWMGFRLIFAIFCLSASHTNTLTLVPTTCTWEYHDYDVKFHCTYSRQFCRFFSILLVESHFFALHLSIFSRIHFVLTSKNTCSWYYQNDHMLYNKYIQTQTHTTLTLTPHSFVHLDGERLLKA